MPPMVRFTHDAVLSAAFELVRRNGLSGLNARAVAQELDSSTQPIFRLFSGMDELRAGVIAMSRESMQEYMVAALKDSQTPYLTMGISYVLFARDEPELFKVLFMGNEAVDMEKMLPVSEMLLMEIQKETGLTEEHAKILHEWLWIFTHGLAISIATKCFSLSEERLKKVLSGAFEAALLKLKQDVQNHVI